SAFDPRQDVVAGAVQNSADLHQFVASQTLLQTGNDWNPSGYRRSECDVLVVLACQTDEFCAMPGDELLVCRDHGFSGLQCAPDPFTCWFEPTDELNDYVHVGGENVIDIVRPVNRARQPVHPLALDVAIADVSEMQSRRRMLG